MSKSSDIKEEKKLQEGIILIKEPKENENNKKIYVFSLKVERLNTVEFIADFSESKNVTMIEPVRQMMQDNQNLPRGKDGNLSQGQDSIKYIDTKSLKQITIIQPDGKEIVAELLLHDNWELKSKLKYIIKPAPKEKQREKIIGDEINKKKDIELIVPQISKLPLPLLTTGEALSLLKACLQDLAVQKSKQNQGQGNPYLQYKFIDPEFLPTDYSIFGAKYDDSAMDTLIQWRRPREIYSKDKKTISILSRISPYDIVHGQLGNYWFLSTLATLAEKPALIKRLFMTQDVNEQGYYRVKICKNGEWQTVSVDDYFPCNPLDGPIFSHAENCQDDPTFSHSKNCYLWVLILEKAYAKLHGNYFSLKTGQCNHALMDLTGCPVDKIDLENKQQRSQYELDQLMKRLQFYQKKDYIMNLQEDDSGYAYPIIRIEKYNNQLLFNIRNVWQEFVWDREWSNKNSLWDKNACSALNPQLGDPKQFWMKFEHVLEKFKQINICKIQNWDEVRVKGKFVKVEDINDSSIETYMSKWYYQFEVPEKYFPNLLNKESRQPTEMGQEKEIVITLHQEDEQIRGVQDGRPYLDIALSLFRLKDLSNLPDKKKKGNNDNYNYEQFHHTKFEVEYISDQYKRQRQIEMTFRIQKPGIYIVLPRTNGLGFKAIQKKQRIQSLFQQHVKDNEFRLTELVESTLVDIFRKFDMLLTRKMTFRQFKAYQECTKGQEQGYLKDYQLMDQEQKLEQEFNQLLQEYPSHDNCLSQQGFLQYLRDKIQNVKDNGKDDYIQKFQNIGYHESLHSIRSRCFIISFHFETELEVVVRDAISTNLDLKASRKYFQLYGDKTKKIYSKDDVNIYYQYFKNANYTTFTVENESQFTYDVEVDFGFLLKNDLYSNNFFSSGSEHIKKRVEFKSARQKDEITNIEVLFHMKGLFSAEVYQQAKFEDKIRITRSRE